MPLLLFFKISVSPPSLYYAFSNITMTRIRQAICGDTFCCRSLACSLNESIFRTLEHAKDETAAVPFVELGQSTSVCVRMCALFLILRRSHLRYHNNVVPSGSLHGFMLLGFRFSVGKFTLICMYFYP